MQIHELNTFSGTPGETDFLAVDAGFDTAKISASKLLEPKISRPKDEHNQYDNGVDGQILRTKGDGSTEWSDVGNPTDAQTAQAVSDWLDAHPEATTTVADGSLTEAKFSAALAVKSIKEYVTPEMFGAVGDGVTDDSAALQAMIDSGKPVFAIDQSKTYLIDNTLVIPRLSQNFTLLGNLKYTGSDYAVRFTCESTSDGQTIGRVYDCEITFGDIRAANGGCLAFTPKNGNYGYVSGMRLKGRIFECSGYCIYVYNTGWFNENKISDINFSAGTNAFYLEMPSGAPSTEISRLTFEHIHVEGVTNGLYFKVDGHNYSGIYFLDCRMNEAISEYYVKFEDSATSANRLLNNIVNIMGYIMNGARYLGDAVYCRMNSTAWVDPGSMTNIGPNLAYFYKGILLNPPKSTGQYQAYNMPADASDPIVVDLSSGIVPILLRSNYGTAIVNLTVPALSFRFLYEIPIQAWGSITFTFNVTTKDGVQTRTLVSTGGGIRYFLYINYATNEVYIK